MPGLVAPSLTSIIGATLAMGGSLVSQTLPLRCVQTTRTRKKKQHKLSTQLYARLSPPVFLGLQRFASAGAHRLLLSQDGCVYERTDGPRRRWRRCEQSVHHALTALTRSPSTARARLMTHQNCKFGSTVVPTLLLHVEGRSWGRWG